MNPWLKVPYDDYIRHMSHDDVYQLQVLNTIFRRSISQFKPSSILVLGCGGGNGFEHIDPKTTTYVAGIDINESYLDHCRKKHNDRGYVLDLFAEDMNELSRDRLAFKEMVKKNSSMRTNNRMVSGTTGTKSFDLVTCYLFFEYVDAERVLDQISPMVNEAGLLNIVIQQNNACEFVSHTGISSLNDLTKIATEVKENDIENILFRKQFEIIQKDIIKLPNGKSFVAYMSRFIG